MPDLDPALLAWSSWIVAQRLAHERRVDFLGNAVERNGAVCLHAALLLEEKQVTRITLGKTDVVRAPCPAVGRRVAIEASMRVTVVLTCPPQRGKSLTNVELQVSCRSAATQPLR